jgi:hypothetical protein
MKIPGGEIFYLRSAKKSEAFAGGVSVALSKCRTMFTSHLRHWFPNDFD